ncbi:MAG: SLC13 family permease [Pseudomonadota bacterium]
MSSTGEGTSGAARAGRIAGPLGGLAILLLVHVVTGAVPPAARVAALAFTMAVLWMTEAIPLAATALFPLVAFPLLGITNTSGVATAYADPAIFLFLGGFLLARCVEDSGLHRRIAVAVLGALGDRPRRQVLGFMITSALLSMWISNTATALVLLPVALAVAAPVIANDAERGRVFATSLLLGVAYGASIGGVGTPVGSPPNVIFLSQLAAAFPEQRIGFARWLLVGLPFVALFVPVAAWWLCRPLGTDPLPGCREVLASQRAGQGRMDRDQWIVAALFATAALGWVFRAPIVVGSVEIPGWSSLVGGSAAVHDAVVAVGVALIAFFVPSSQRPGQRLLTWASASRIAWGLLILFGGGIALARGFSLSGLSSTLGGLFAGLQGVPLILVIAAITTLVIFLTELTSNTATTTVMMPILASLALALQVPAVAIMLPAAIAASCAFMLPVATPPNAVVFSSGQVPLRDMMRAGFFLNLIGVVLITLLALGPGRWLVTP